MRGRRNPQSTMLAFVNLDERVPPVHPLRIINRVTDDALDRMSDEWERMYSSIGGGPSRASAEVSAAAHAVLDQG